MGRHLRRWTAVVILAASALQAQAPARPVSVAAGQPITPPPLDEIIGRALARAKAQDEAAAELRFESIVETTVMFLDDDGEITEINTSRARRYAIEGSVYEELIERDGRTLTKDERRDEHEKREAFRRKAAEATGSGEVVETNDERQIRFDRDLMARYHASMVGEAVIRDELCWVIKFEPRAGRLSKNRRIDRALNNSSGRIYITQKEAAVSRIEFKLQRPVLYLWGLIAALRDASGRLDFERAEPNVWLPKMFDIRSDLRIFFRRTRRHVIRTWVERTHAETE